MIKSAQAIFVVGPDTVGKTTVTRELANISGLPRFKCPAEKEMFRERKFAEHLAFDLFLPHFVEQTGRGFISDRGYPCEYAYSRALGRETDMQKLGRIDQLWANRDAFIVVLRKHSYVGANDDLVSDEDLAEVDDAYNVFSQWTGVQHMTIFSDEFTGPTWATDIAERILVRVAAECELPDPQTEQEFQLHEVIYWRNDLGNPESFEYDKETLLLRRAYHILKAGNLRGALYGLTTVPREILPNSFWEVLGRAW